jgi:hypothetical protein
MATLILDIGAGLNLLAGKRAAAIAADVGVRLVLEASCAAGCDVSSRGGRGLISAGLQTQVDAEVIEMVELNEAELPLYVQPAGRIGDQEAATPAVAASRRWGVVTDDSVLIRAASDVGGSVPTRTTAALLHAWARSAAEINVNEALRRIETHAAFRPPVADQWCRWWHEHLAPTGVPD